ncbi:MAG: PAS domain S-box protein, partial [Actinomycetota bacterium]|nr:PAS domain S-box protein [Actinomycetota bacterium]
EREDPGLEIVSVATAEEALRLLEEDGFQVVVSDYVLGPGMSGIDLLKAVRERDPELPFILLTGQGNEEVASLALREGADDYIIKRSGLLQFKRVALTIRRQWETHRARLARREAEGRYRHLVENVNAGIALARGERFVYVNPKLCEMTGYTAEELTSRPFAEFLVPAYRELVMDRYRRRQAGEELPPTYEIWAYHKDGREICLELTASILRDEEGVYTLAVLRDVTAQKRAEERAEQAEERLRLVFQQASDAIFLHDLEGNILEVNPAATELTGYSREELLSMRVQDLHIPDERSLSEQELLKTRQGDFFGFVGTGLCKDGSIKKCAVTGTLIRGSDRPLLLSLVKELPEAEDFEEKVAMEARERFQAAIDQAPLVAVQGYNREGMVTYWNRASEELYGFRREEALGKTLDQLILTGEDAEVFRRELDRLWKGGEPAPPREWITRDQKGRTRWVLSTIFPIRRGGECLEVFCMDLDITERKNLETELQERNQDLEAFAQMVSHDLRAPLTSIEGFAALARQAAEGRFEPAEMEYFDYILRACRGMESMIASILEMARSGLQPENRREVELEGLVHEVWDELRVEERSPAARLELDLAQPAVRADPALLRQVLANLVDNAVKFNLDHPSPLVRVISRKEASEAVVIVRDNGPGILEEDIEHLFEPFRRMNQSTPGLGIGLSAVRRIVSRWKGRLEVESKPGEGSAFSFTIPD